MREWGVGLGQLQLLLADWGSTMQMRKCLDKTFMGKLPYWNSLLNGTDRRTLVLKSSCYLG